MRSLAQDLPMTDIPISAYIICKNERRFLGKCLDSLEGVREIVVVDSGSTDGTLDLIRDYQQRGFPSGCLSANGKAMRGRSSSHLTNVAVTGGSISTPMSASIPNCA